MLFQCGGTGARPTKDGLNNVGFPSGVAGVPVEEIQQAVNPSDEQRAALDELANASVQAAQIIKASCPTDVSLTPIGRIDAMRQRVQAMLDAAAPRLKTGVKMLSETIRGDVREGDIGTELGEIAKQHPNVTIGSYPFFDEKTGPNTNLVIRSRDAAHLAAARAEVEAMLTRVRAAVKVNV